MSVPDRESYEDPSPNHDISVQGESVVALMARFLILTELVGRGVVHLHIFESTGPLAADDEVGPKEMSERGEVEEEDMSKGDIGGDADNMSDVTEGGGNEEEMPELKDASDDEESID